MPSDPDVKTINTVLFDFGGVLADEGFRDGLAAIGRLSGVAGEDVVVKGHEKQLLEVYNACVIGTEKFLHSQSKDRVTRPRLHQEDGTWKEISYDEAVEYTAQMLAKAKKPLMYGWSSTNCEAQSVGNEIAEITRACCDNTAAVCHGTTLIAVQDIGLPTCTLGEVKNRADRIIFWGCNPVHAHPRHMSRYSIYPRGFFRQGTDEPQDHRRRPACHGYRQDGRCPPAGRAGQGLRTLKRRAQGASLAGIATVQELKIAPSYAAYDKNSFNVEYSGVKWHEEHKSILVWALVHPESEPILDWWSMKVPGFSPGNRIMRAQSKKIRIWLGEELGINALSLPYQIEYGGAFLKDAAALAGLGIIGMNNLLVTPEYGPRVRLRGIFLEAELEPTGTIDFDPCSGCPLQCHDSYPNK